ncbi:hypothetical protein INT43_007605 [Umbelopsis isabellina]|uniref:Cytochrome P450 n=1 Tax=Mortierella isabellina TaxID=91625 RepID=A0A8H7PN27_MORIS|nr:hypothetical protein INT43_007605 [Umbelopsis isabellina]
MDGFGFDFNAINNLDGEWVTTYDDIADNIADFQFLFLSTFDTTLLSLFPARQKHHNSVEKMDKLFYSVIEHKKKALSQAKTDVDERHDEDDKLEPLSSIELRDELVVFFLTGHDTTANTLTSAMYFLAVNLDIQKKARDEVLRILGDDYSDISPTLHQLKEFKYLNNVMKEAVRLALPAHSLIERTVSRDTEIAGTFIPKGSLVKANILGLHYNPNFWNEPAKFTPDRFCEGGELESRSSIYSYLPFGGGYRQCIV